LLAEYGFDLVENWETVGCRRLWVLVQGLPIEAAVWREENAWTQQDEFAASQLEMTHALWRLVNSGLGGRDIQPLRIDRPGIGRDEPDVHSGRISTTDTRVIAQWFATHSGI
jgi:hypothetical protein